MTKNFALLDQLLKEHAKGHVSMNGDMNNYVLFKYTQDCVNEDAWNDINRQARGIIFYAPTATIVARPFDKFFNLDERQETKLENLPNEPFVVWEKLDGSCCSAYLHFNEIRCATPGSYESPQAQWATEWLNNYINSLGEYPKKTFIELLGSCTFIFEGIWPESKGNPAPPVVNYGDREELVLLSIRYLDGTEFTVQAVDEIAKVFNFSRPNRILVDKLDRTLAEKVPDNEEGYVIQFLESNLRVKVKSPTYVMLHKMKDSITHKGICEIFEGGESRRWLTTLPKHLAEKADDIIAELQRKYWEIFYKVEDVYKQALVLSTRKEQALHIQNVIDGRYRGLVFNKLDNKFSERNIWKIMRQEYENE